MDIAQAISSTKECLESYMEALAPNLQSTMNETLYQTSCRIRLTEIDLTEADLHQTILQIFGTANADLQFNGKP